MPIKTMLVGLCFFLLITAGCMRYIRYDALPEGKLHAETESYLRDFKQAYELENRYLLRTLVDDRFGGTRWGSDRIIERMSKIFNQYRDIELTLGKTSYRRMSRSLIVKFNWNLTWTCEDIDPSRGCEDFNGDDRPDTVRRSGRTIFTLVYKDGEWFLKNEEGDLLVGLFAPGYREIGG